jgi:hypothetical protein
MKGTERILGTLRCLDRTDPAKVFNDLNLSHVPSSNLPTTRA